VPAASGIQPWRQADGPLALQEHRIMRNHFGTRVSSNISGDKGSADLLAQLSEARLATAAMTWIIGLAGLGVVVFGMALV
jgi:hypothetical protein